MARLIEAPIVLRDMTSEDLDTANRLSEEESWPHRREDWQLFYEVGEGLVATIGDRVAGTVLAFRYGPHHASVGMLLEDREFGDSGIAPKLLAAMLDRLGEDVNVQITAVPERIQLYARMGFTPCAIVHQHQGIAPTMPLVELREGERVRPMGENERDLPGLYCSATGLDRTALFDALARGSSGIVLSRDHEPVGFALLRRFGRGRVIAPIVAPDIDGAKLLAAQLLGTRAGKFCRIDAVEGFGMSKWLEASGLPRVASVTTMVRGTAVVVTDGPQVFGIASQAYGL